MLQLGTVIGSYRIEGVIGAGGFGAVYIQTGEERDAFAAVAILTAFSECRENKRSVTYGVWHRPAGRPSAHRRGVL